eukprot:2153252-Karenia_brevis.AAC.1
MLLHNLANYDYVLLFFRDSMKLSAVINASYHELLQCVRVVDYGILMVYIIMADLIKCPQSESVSQ